MSFRVKYAEDREIYPVHHVINAMRRLIYPVFRVIWADDPVKDAKYRAIYAAHGVIYAVRPVN